MLDGSFAAAAADADVSAFAFVFVGGLFTSTVPTGRFEPLPQELIKMGVDLQTIDRVVNACI